MYTRVPYPNLLKMQGFGISSTHHSLQPSWFQGAPLTKFVCVVVCISFMILEMGKGGRNNIAIDDEKIFYNSQLHRLIFYSLSFGSMGELIMGLAVLCSLLRRFEREMGTQKFASYLFLKSMILATIFQLLMLGCLDNIPRTFTAGPYPQIGALLFLFHLYTPRIHPKFFGILGLDTSEKAFTYFFIFQLVFSGGASTVIPTLCGFVAGMLSISAKTPLGRSDLGFPQFIHRLCSIVGHALGLDNLYSCPIVAPRLRMSSVSSGTNSGGGRLVPDNISASAVVPAQQPIPASPPSESLIEQLTVMGFERNAVIRALRATDNNPEAAANRLLTGV